MSKLLVGTLISPTKMLVETIYNLEVEENDGIDRSLGVIVSAEAVPPQYQAGKGYTWYVNPQTSEQFFEEYDRPLTPEEETQLKLHEQEQEIAQLWYEIMMMGASA